MKRVTSEGMQGVVILVDLRGVADGKRRLYLCDSDVWSRQDIRSARYSAECAMVHMAGQEVRSTDAPSTSAAHARRLFVCGDCLDVW